MLNVVEVAYVLTTCFTLHRIPTLKSPICDSLAACSFLSQIKWRQKRLCGSYSHRLIDNVFGMPFISPQHGNNNSIFAKNDIQQEGEVERPQRRVCIIDDSSSLEYSDVVSKLISKTALALYSETADALAPFSHCLRVIPHESTYAIAIEPLPRHGVPNSARGRRRRSKTTPAKPFYIELCPPSDSRLGKRSKGQTGSDLLIKAVSPARFSQQSQPGAIVYDLTAGFGQDSVVIAHGGAARVHMVERDPAVAMLLDDALRRLRWVAQYETKDNSRKQRALDLSTKLSVELADGIKVAENVSIQGSQTDDLPLRPDVCYLDPMFPSRTKSAAVKKNMQILHDLLESQKSVEDDAGGERSTNNGEAQLLEAAYEAARSRVVVKRPIKAQPIGGRKPSYDVRGSVSRWDVYVKV